MQQHDEVVSGWLNGSNSVEGLDSPAGPLYLDNADSVLMSSENTIFFTGLGGTTASCRPSSCACC
ncbi:hypothetical protein DFR29_111186 [Tahibacter aquaticus]|uniref:Uncharacterized protein n=1 Tax=Tahibacter aquaticus TaxID=520092 RepID=A0A4R6YT54_9GAMM|nr:DUF6229 family protein [Tahibacter aquaticus]TDR41272.1 hypothetical protein DFR29_111186 [Tahibacter aquaticus]